MSPGVSETGLPGLSTPVNRPMQVVEAVQRWMQAEVDNNYPVDDATPTATQIIDTFEQTHNYLGDWLV